MKMSKEATREYVERIRVRYQGIKTWVSMSPLKKRFTDSWSTSTGANPMNRQAISTVVATTRRTPVTLDLIFISNLSILSLV